MPELLTAAQMRAIEQAAIKSGAVTGLELMERAGSGVVEAIFEEWPELAQPFSADNTSTQSVKHAVIKRETRGDIVRPRQQWRRRVCRRAASAGTGLARESVFVWRCRKPANRCARQL